MTDEPDKVDLDTPDLAADHRAYLSQLFPGVLQDGVLDAAKLGELLNMPVAQVPDGRERYGLQWAGKSDAVRSLLVPSRGTLVPDPENSIEFDSGQNAFIEGDSLEVLKLLQKAYNDKIKLIYIDPPYNSGNDFVYDDDFRDGLKAYLEYTKQVDDEGKRKSASADTMGRRHSRWLSMMYPRLVLARNLLSQDGAIFVSIDDNEVANLRLLMDEVFGAECFVASVIWRRKSAPDARSTIGAVHDYLLCYVRDGSNPKSAIGKMALSESRRAAFSNPDGDGRGPWVSVDMTAMTGRATSDQYFKVTLPSGRQVGPPEGRAWGVVERTYKQLLAEKRIWFGKNGDGVPRMKRFLEEVDGQTVPSYWDFTEVGSNEEASDELLERFDGSKPFDTPKPVRLMRRLLEIGTRPKGGDIVLDFFAGSGTMADAVLQQNAADGGDRRFIMVQLPQATSGPYETIADITWARIQAAYAAVGAGPGQGFRSYSLGESNFMTTDLINDGEELQLNPHTLRQADVDVRSVAAQIFLMEGVTLDASWHEHDFGDVSVEVCGGVAAVIGSGVDETLVDRIFDLEPRVVVFLEDDLAGKDPLKANTFLNARNRGITMKTV